MSKNDTDAKITTHIYRRMYFVINFEDCNFHKKVWHKGGIQLAEIAANNVREDELNPRLGYAMVRIENWHNTCLREVTGYIRDWKTMCSDWLDCI